MDPQRIIIIGGGIGGLAAGLALLRRGFKTTVYERADAFREIGAGLIVTANARRALADLGVDDALAACSSNVRVRNTCNYATGAVMQEISNAEIERRYGYANLQVHRGDLHNVLLDGIRAIDPQALVAGHDFARLDQDDAGVTVHFRNGVTVAGDAVIGADGNASAVRSQLFPGEATTFNGQVAYRALIPRDRVPDAIMDLQMAMHPGPQRYLLIYPLRHGDLLNVIGCGKATAWAEEGWAIPATTQEFADAYSDFAPQLVEMIGTIPEGELFKWGLRDREPLATWVAGRVAMLGDAAHPMTPFLGQGACIAIEDGLVLGRAFAASATVAEALARYEAARRERGTNVQLWSREEGEALQDPDKPRRTAIDRGLLDYDPVTVAV